MARSHKGGAAAASSVHIGTNLQRSTGAARSLSFALAGVSQHLAHAAGASAELAEGIAHASNNAKIAASAAGIGAVVAVLATIAAFTVNWKEETKEVANKIREIHNETARLDAQAK